MAESLITAQSDRVGGGNGASGANPKAAVLARANNWNTDGRGFLLFDNWGDTGTGFITDEDKFLMLTDPQVYAALRIRRAAVTFEGVQVLPTYQRGEPGYEKSREIADGFRWALGEIEWGLHFVLEQLLEHDWWKHTAGELIQTERTYDGKQFACFDIDPHGPWDYTVWKKGHKLLGLQPNGGENSDKVYGAEKFIWLPFRPNSRHWCGTDLAGVTWTDFYMKNVNRPENLKYMTQFSGPSWVGTAPEDVQGDVVLLSDKKDAWGRPIPLKDQNGQEILVSPQQAMISGLQNFQGAGSGTVIPPRAKLALMEAQGDGRIFVTFDDARDWQIMVAILGTGNMTGRAKYGSNASAQTGQTAVEKPANTDAQILANVLRQKVARLWVKWNYGEKHLDKVPRILMGGDDYLESVFMSVIANSEYGQDERFLEELASRIGAPIPDFKAFLERLKERMALGPKPGTVAGTGQQQEQQQ